MTLMPENDEGNTEYKRYLINLDSNRLEQLSTQMKWRLAEGENEAIYYLGIDDDGTPYPMTEQEKKESLNNFTLLLEKNKANIVNFEVMKTQYNNKPMSYFKITIRKISPILPEIRVLLLGDSSNGKTTFLSNILLNKIDINNEARIYLMNHKHELETKKTSSINCYYKFYDNIKYTFMEAPGCSLYNRTKYKALLGTHPDICLLFTDSNNNVNPYYLFLLEKLCIKYLIINIFDTNSNYNCKKIINKKYLFDSINQIIKLEKTNQIKQNNSDIKLNIINVYPHTDLGIVVSGFLSNGKVEINKSIYWVNKTDVIKCKIKSIHINSEPIKECNSNNILTLCLKPNKTPKKKIKNGILYSKKPILKNKIIFHFLNFNNKNLLKKCFGYCQNKLVYLTNIKKINDNLDNLNNTIYSADISNYYDGDGPIIIDNNFNRGIIIN